MVEITDSTPSAFPLTFPVVVEHDRDGYFATCPSFQGCYAQGDTYEEAMRNIEDAIRLHVEDRKADGEVIEQPVDVSVSLVRVAL